ncbi:inactive cell surface hyaluronidase CEMIP2-like [Nyctibius grandis]|uniref:inactive cell surface hyaluronidase CEMIP2-like n=1 Tax=Nyctibius grandis TaxID=48427 RepID=UPI0035BBB972
MSVFTRLGSAKPIVFHKEGSFAMLGYKGQAKPSWIKVLNHAGYQKAASLQHYVPLKLKEYQCPANANESLKFALSQSHLGHVSGEFMAPRD